VDQNNIEEDLQCLPIFLAGCNLMLVLSGATYHTRLWCCAEMLIYRAMLVTDPSRSDPAIWSLGNTEPECEANQQKWSAFSVDDCDCFKQSDKQRFLKVVASYPGGAEGFNGFIRDIAGNFSRHFITKSIMTFDQSSSQDRHRTFELIVDMPVSIANDSQQESEGPLSGACEHDELECKVEPMETSDTETSVMPSSEVGLTSAQLASHEPSLEIAVVEEASQAKISERCGLCFAFSPCSALVDLWGHLYWKGCYDSLTT
jgi:hypothetical protein